MEETTTVNIGKETKEFWDISSLRAFSAMTKDCMICGKWVTIKKLPISLINEVDQASTFDFIVEGLVTPKLTKEQAKALPLDFAKGLLEAITKFSDVSQEAAEKN